MLDTIIRLLPIIIGVGVFVSASAIVTLFIYRNYARIVKLNNEGLQYTEWEMWDQAVVSFRKALAIDPQNALTHYNLGFVLYHGKRCYNSALDEFSKSLEGDPEMAGAHYAMGHLLFHCKHDVDAAFERLSDAVKLAPDLAEVHNTLGLIHIQREQWEEAMDAFRTAIETNPEYDAAYCNLSIACIYQGKNADAEHLAEQYVRLQPASATAHNNLGNIYGATRRRQKAIAEFRRSLQINREDWIVHFWLGCLYLQTKECAKAVVCFHEAIRRQAGFALGYYNLALCYESLGEKESARTHMDRAIELNPELGKDLIKTS